MSTIRVTQQALTAKSLQGLQEALARIDKNQNALSSGKILSKPSDDPAAVSDALRYKSDLKRNDQLQKNVHDAQSWLNTTDATLSTIITSVQRVRNLVLQAVNGSADQAARDSAAQEIAQLKSQVLGLSNTKYGDQLLFAGSSDVTASFDNSGAYQGNTDAMYRTIGPGGERLQVNMDGQTVFGTGATQLFTVIQDIYDHLTSGTPADVQTANTTDLANLDTATRTLQVALSTTGARAARADSTQDRLMDLQGTTKGQLSSIQDTDMAKTIMDLQMNQTAYQAALSATSRVIQPSLMDFLR